MGTVQAVMALMQDTTLFVVLTEGRRWIFDPIGAWPDQETGRINKSAPYCLCHAYHITTRVAIRLCVCAHTFIDM